MTAQTTSKHAEAKNQFVGETYMGKILIKIHKSALIGELQGGDGGPGKIPPDSEKGMGATYSWSLPIADLSSLNQQEITNTLANCIACIAGGALCAGGGLPVAATGTYDGVQVQLSTTPTASPGQLQIYGVGIDLSSANQGSFAQVSSLPVGFWVCQPVPGNTQRVLGISIEE